MKQTYYNFNAREIPILAGQILNNFKRDKSYFELYSPKFNFEFLATFEEKVNSLIKLADSQTFDERIRHSKENIEILIHNFDPLLNYFAKFLELRSFDYQK